MDAIASHRQPELDALEWPVRALAQPAEVQFRLFPSFVCIADELALEFEEKLEQIGAGKVGALMNSEQLSLFLQLDQQLIAMSGPVNARLWTEDALRDASEWEIVRRVAAALAVLMRWSLDPPPPSSAIYVKG